MTCRNCAFSRSRLGLLWCAKWNREALEKCQAFEYEPGTTDDA